MLSSFKYLILFVCGLTDGRKPLHTLGVRTEIYFDAMNLVRYATERRMATVSAESSVKLEPDVNYHQYGPSLCGNSLSEI